MNQSPLAPLLYRSYLVRLWRDNAQGPWRASARSVQGGEVIRFATLQAMFAFLEAQTEQTRQINDDDQPSPDATGNE